VTTIKVIGAGFGRTGTTTLKWALEKLLGGPCHHMQEIFAHPEQIRVWARKGRGEKTDLAEVLEGYVAAVDWPAAAYYAELAEQYPEAKVVLTVRDFDRWYESAHETIYWLYTITQKPPLLWMFKLVPKMREFPEMVADIIWGERGTFGERFQDREHARAVFDRHVEEVKRTIPAERLLVYAPSEGWEPLCRFLGVPVPDEPMPRMNERQEMISMGRKMTAAAWVLLPVSAPVALGRRLLGLR
jgi:hypothetical protein